MGQSTAFHIPGNYYLTSVASQYINGSLGYLGIEQVSTTAQEISHRVLFFSPGRVYFRQQAAGWTGGDIIQHLFRFLKIPGQNLHQSGFPGQTLQSYFLSCTHQPG
jgi:hypothetical protein